MRFTSLRITNWRNFRSAEVPLRPRTFIVGPNASGKSNLLDAFRFLKEIAERGGTLYGAIERRGGIKAIRSLHAREKTDVELEATVSAGDGTEWKYTLVVGQMSRDNAVPVVRREEIAHFAGLALSSERRDASMEDTDERGQTWLENKSKKAFRELAQFFASIEYSHVVPQVVREQRRAPNAGRQQDPYGADLIEDMARTPDRERRRRLTAINDALGGILPQFKKLRIEQDKVGRPHLLAGYKHWRGPLAKQDEAQFSDGTLRLIGLLWMLSKPGGPVLLEEPEISLHDRAVKALPTIIHRVAARNDRQVLVSTHSEAMLNDEGIEPREVVVLRTTDEDTQVKQGSAFDLLVQLAAQGRSFGAELAALTAPPDPEQLLLFGEGSDADIHRG